MERIMVQNSELAVSAMAGASFISLNCFKQWSRFLKSLKDVRLDDRRVKVC